MAFRRGKNKGHLSFWSVLKDDPSALLGLPAVNDGALRCETEVEVVVPVMVSLADRAMSGSCGGPGEVHADV